MYIMRIHTTTAARKDLARLVNLVKFTRKPVAIGRRNAADVLMIKFPDHANVHVTDETNMNQYGGGFDFLNAEPELYTRKDLKKSYV